MILLLALMSAHAAPPSLWKDTVRVRAATASPTGADLLVAVDRQLQVRTPADGSIRAKVPACDDPIALGFTDEHTAILICESEAQTVSWPGLAVRTRQSWSGRAEAGAVGPKGFAVGFTDGNVSIYGNQGNQPIERQSWTEIETLEFDPTGDWLILANDDRKPLRLYPHQGEPTVLTPTGDVATFSPDGTHIFALHGGFKASYNSIDGTEKSSFRTGSWINAARFLDGQRILAGGSDGLVIYQVGQSKPVEVVAKGSRWDHLALGDGWQCAANWTELGCWGAVGTASSQVAMQAQPPAASTQVGPSNFGTKGLDTTPVPSEMNLVSRRGNTITARLTDGPAPMIGSRTSLSKHVTKQLGRMSMTAWLEIADVTVSRVNGTSLILTIEEEKSVVMVNGEKVDHFTPGSRLRVE